MKLIKYVKCLEINVGTKEEPILEQHFNEVSITCASSSLESNLEVVKSEAYKGEYTVEDVEEPEAETLEERTAALEEALTLLLEGATE